MESSGDLSSWFVKVLPSGVKIGFVNLVSTNLLSSTSLDPSTISLIPFKTSITDAIAAAKTKHPDVLTFVLAMATDMEYEAKGICILCIYIYIAQPVF